MAKVTKRKLPEVDIRKLINNPEINIAFFSFAFHFIWEFIQIPTYAGMTELEHWQGVLVCTQATFGDAGIALVAFWTASISVRSRHWIRSLRPLPLSVYWLMGLVITVTLELIYTEITHRWTYSELMPLVPPLGTGLSPLLQWILVPLLVVFVVQRQIRD